MAEILKMKKGCKISTETILYEGYAVDECSITANVGIDKIEGVLQHFIVMHDDEPLFFILELPANAVDETEIAPGVLDKLHKDVYYIDGCKPEEALTILFRVGELLFNDGVSSFGFGCHNSQDEIMFGKYNVLTIYSQNINAYNAFFEPHEIEKTDNLITAWDTFSVNAPGVSERYEDDGKTVFDIPEQFKEWGIYLAEQREDS